MSKCKYCKYKSGDNNYDFCTHEMLKGEIIDPETENRCGNFEQMTIADLLKGKHLTTYEQRSGRRYSESIFYCKDCKVEFQPFTSRVINCPCCNQILTHCPDCNKLVREKEYR